MYFFDNKTLQQYLKTGEKLQVFANKEYLTITDDSDVSDTQYGAGIDTTGKTIPFSYKEIDHLKIGGFIYTLDQLQKSFETPEPKPEEDSANDASGDKQPTDAEPKPDAKTPPQKPSGDTKEKDLKTDKTESIDVNNFVKNNDPNSRHYGSSGPVQFISDGMVTYKTFVEGRYSNITVPSEYVKPMTIVEKTK